MILLETLTELAKRFEETGNICIGEVVVVDVTREEVI